MYRTRIRAVAWFLFVFVFYVFYDSYFSLFLLVASLVIFLFLGISTRLYKNRVQISIVTPSIMNKQDSGECHIEAKNNSFLPIAKVGCVLKVHNVMTGEISQQEVFFSLNGKAKDRVPVYLKSNYCGNIKIHLEKVICFDLLGLFYTLHEPKTTEELLVLPNTFEMNVDLYANKSKNNEAFSYSSELVGMNSSEIFGIKPYVPGDNVKNIHWKLSSKFDDLIMKELSESIDHSLLVLLDTSGMIGNPDVSDAMMEAFVSLSKALLENEYTHSIGWMDRYFDDLQVEEVFSKDHLFSLVTSILKIESMEQNESSLDVYFKHMNRYPFSQIIYITSQSADKDVEIQGINVPVTTLRCVSLSDKKNRSRDGIVFTPDSFEEDLRQLII